MKLAQSLLAIAVLSTFCSAANADPAKDPPPTVQNNLKKTAEKKADAMDQYIRSIPHSTPPLLPGETMPHYVARLEQQARLTAAFFAAQAAAKSQSQ